MCALGDGNRLSPKRRAVGRPVSFPEWEEADGDISISLGRVTCERLALKGGLGQLPAIDGPMETMPMLPASFLLEISFASCARRRSQAVMWAGKDLTTRMPRSMQQSVGEWQMIRRSWSSESSSKAQQGGAASELAILEATFCQEIPSSVHVSVLTLISLLAPKRVNLYLTLGLGKILS